MDSTEIDIPANAAAIIFHVDGSTSLAIPKTFMVAAYADVEVPEGVLAATELIMRLQTGELSLKELADAFEMRVKS